jgi:putative colanic acid biosynthesis acetyltransferase WcaF
MNSIRSFFWTFVGQPLFAFTPHNAYIYRTAILKLFGMKCGNRVRLRRSVTIDQPWHVTADDLVIFGDGVVVHAGEQITIGKRSVISQYAMLVTVVGDCRTAGVTLRRGPITIEDDCWVATDAVVMPTAHVENGTVVGARSLVEGTLPSWKICTGEPAKPRGERELLGTT